MKKQTIAIALAILLSGCAAVASVSSLIGDVVNQYCSQDEIGRQVLRQQFAAVTAPNTIMIQCEGDLLNINPVSVTQ